MSEEQGQTMIVRDRPPFHTKADNNTIPRTRLIGLATKYGRMIHQGQITNTTGSRYARDSGLEPSLILLSDGLDIDKPRACH